jgi:hypothetical protein
MIKEDNAQEKIVDEYNISQIFSNHNVENNDLLADIEIHLNRILTTKLQNKEQQKKHFNNVMFCCLSQALNDTEDDESKENLVNRIQLIVNSCNTMIKK